MCVCGRQRQRKRETEEEETLEGKSKDSNCPKIKSSLLLTAAGWDGFGTQRDGDAGVRTVWFH